MAPDVKKPARIPFSTTSIRPKSNEVEQRKRNRQLTDSNPLSKVCLDNQKLVIEGDKIDSTMIDTIGTIQKMIAMYFSSTMYHGKSVLEWKSLLPVPHQDTGRILSIVFVPNKTARALFELQKFEAALQCFEKIRAVEPFRLQDMSLFGTCLWHLRKTTELGSLGKELEMIDAGHPETLCVIGNYYSLIQDPDSAIKAFDKACNADLRFEYSRTLLGHEYLANDDLDEAAKCFRGALKINPRHYNALYGLGLIEQKQERFALAEHHFRKALEISPENSILKDTLASVWNFYKVIQTDTTRYQEALDLYDQVIKSTPDQKVFAYHRALLLFEMEAYEEVVKLMSNEASNSKTQSNVYFLLGKALAKIGKRQEAIKAMTLAQDYLQHKSSSIIKDFIGIYI